MFPQAKRHMIHNLAILLASTLVAGSTAHAQGSKNAPAPTSGAAPAAPAASTDKLDVSDLEKKYWAAKDSDFSVVQNRLYGKANRLALTLDYGYAINDPWSDGPTYGASLAYYFSERFGIEAHYFNSNMRDNKATSTLKNQLGSPDHNKLKGFQGVSFNFVPFYAKMSVLNSSIIYFDMAFNVGAGMQQYSQQLIEGDVDKSTPAITFDVSQHFFLSRYFAVRADLKNRWYQEEVVKYRPSASVPDRKVSNDWANTSLLMLGVEFLF